ncbi:DUF87 domain-containing protein [Curtobacterium flaccumfaciens pv. flaccumfaciens]|uniref:DUF87 domain-containing protein n=1 Tax=Curtobacterium flaccumfaciens pv. flaccumfaciens TaxID=138532 RepID=A0A9Q2W2W1_9MICO|nr:DUF87 domain-containing protein [Curtobacterium flaccumfaciens]MBT1541003.1 DUF87 domain-containing protein [Curtobacterium flaccumfaciens pv. flaccumfaciens]
MTELIEFTRIVSVSPSRIDIEITDIEAFEQSELELEVGSVLRISDEAGSGIVAAIESYSIRELPQADGRYTSRMLLQLLPVGSVDSTGKFVRGANKMSIPPKRTEVASGALLRAMFSQDDLPDRVAFSVLQQDSNIPVGVSGNSFFGQHLAVVGSTGSGKSTTVARLVQAVLEGESAGAERRNTHVVFFDAHGEYGPAFPGSQTLSAQNLDLPYWLMTSAELEALFVESAEMNSHNQLSQFRYAVRRNKQMHNGNSLTDEITIDSPAFFSMAEVSRYLDNVNREVVSKKPEDHLRPKLHDDSFIDRGDERYFKDKLQFAETSTGKENRASAGPFNGEFDRFVVRIEQRLADRRMQFLLGDPHDPQDGQQVRDRERILRRLVGYVGGSEANVTRLDLSDMPYDIVPIVVGMIARLVFEMNVARKREIGWIDVPFMLVLEEAHNYVARGDGRGNVGARGAVERIAKEGRKYGVLMMVVSQRPGEISETVLAQCANFVVMRLANPVDKAYIRHLLPDDMGSWMEGISVLPQRHAILIGSAMSASAVVVIDEVTDRPSSADVAVLDEWRKEWVEMTPSLGRT